MPEVVPEGVPEGMSDEISEGEPGGDASSRDPSEGCPTPVDAFAQWAASKPVRLDRAALAIAAHCRTKSINEAAIDEAATLAELDRLGTSVREATPEAVVDLLFHVEGFGPNRVRFADPANSYLDLVVSRRHGIPITLAVVAMEVARRAGVALHGVGMPGHFLVGTADPQVLIDPLEGRIIDRNDAAAIFHRFESQQTFDEKFLRPTPPVAVLMRMLNNLRTLHLQQPDAPSQLAVLELLTRLPGCPPEEYLRLAQALAARGRPDEGARALEEVADRFSGRNRERLLLAATRLWAQLN